MNWRDEIIQQFSGWLYDLTEEEFSELKDDEAAEENNIAPDLFDLFGELTAIRQEIKIQSKTVQGAGRRLETVNDDLKTEIGEQFKALTNTNHTNGFKGKYADHLNAETTLIELIFIRDNIIHCLELAETYRIPEENIPSRPWIKKPYMAMENMYQSIQRLLRKIDDTLYRLNIHTMVEMGMAFDAGNMKAVAVSKNTGAARGTITEIVRQGYKHNEQILQLPEVQVEE